MDLASRLQQLRDEPTTAFYCGQDRKPRQPGLAQKAKHAAGWPKSGVEAPPELRCDVSMLKGLWRKIVERHRRNIAELEQIEMEMAKEEAHLPLPPAFPQKPYKASTIVLFIVVGFFVAFAAWVCFKELVLPFFG